VKSIRFIEVLYDLTLPLPLDEKIYEELMAEPDFLSVAPQLYHLLNIQDRLKETPLFFQENLQNEFKEAFYQNLFIKNQSDQILKKFEKEEIMVIPLKGTLFAEKYFGHLGARSTSDIDLLIQSSNLQHAIEIVKSLGFLVEQEKIVNHFHCNFSKSLPGSEIPLTVELHWHLLKEDTTHLDIGDVWNEAMSIGTYQYVKELSAYHTFYFMCIHSWRHNLNSLRYFIDMIQLIHFLKVELDFERLRREIHVHQTSKRITRTLSIVYQAFPHLHRIQECPFNYSKYFLTNIAFNNRYKKGLWKYIDFIDYKLLSLDTRKHKLLQIKNLFK
jgi:hypothetical protein